jgi:hypothetical protein
LRGFAVDYFNYPGDGCDSVRDIETLVHASPHRFAVGNRLEPLLVVAARDERGYTPLPKPTDLVGRG